jgi:hypothetical protein
MEFIIGLAVVGFIAILFFSNVGKDYSKKTDMELSQLLTLHKKNVAAASKVGPKQHQAALERMAPWMAEMKKRGLVRDEATAQDPLLQETLEGIAQKNFGTSLKNIEDAAVQGDAKAMYQMAMLFHVAKEKSSCLQFMEKSAEAGYLDAQYALAWALHQEGPDKQSQSLKWFTIAAKLGHPEALKSVGVAEKSVSPATLQRVKYEANTWLTEHGHGTT